ncbi:HAD family hydrolase [Candidatus Bipolaricaulota bacterium]
MQAIGFDLDWTLSYYPLSTHQVLLEAFDRTSHSVELLGDLAAAAERYNSLWLALERSVESTEDLRRQIMTALFEERGIENAAAVFEVSEAYGAVRRESGVLPYPETDELLADLKPHFKLGLLTNGPSDIQWEKIKALGYDKLFDAIIVAGDIRIYKPDKQVFELLLGMLGADAECSLFVGDNYPTDIVGAHQTGMHTAWIKRDEDATIEGGQPTLVMSDTSMLREVLL